MKQKRISRECLDNDLTVMLECEAGHNFVKSDYDLIINHFKKLRDNANG
jgi:hypothetical protein